MKYIIKETEPQEFSIWKRKNTRLNYSDLSKRVSEEDNSAKDSIYIALQKEQGYICCYCEGELKNYKYHIEHIKPQSKFPGLALDYNNMLCSCQGQVNNETNLYCGHKKDKWYDEKYFVSPLDPSCEERFKFTEDGYINPVDSNDKAAITTIDKLNLDIDKLNARRRNAIIPFINENDSLSDDDLKTFVDGYLVDKENNNGKYNEFYTTIKYLFANQ